MTIRLANLVCLIDATKGQYLGLESALLASLAKKRTSWVGTDQDGRYELSSLQGVALHRFRGTWLLEEYIHFRPAPHDALIISRRWYGRVTIVTGQTLLSKSTVFVY